ncbi:MAG: phosphoribosyltransferase family protein [Candidatus Moraniibacteriota bacterium]
MITKISWAEIENAIDDLATQIKQANFEADYIIGIASGGLVPLGLLAKKMNFKNVLTVTARSYQGETQGELEISYLPAIDLRGKKILLIDELADSGETLKKLSAVMVEHYQPSELRTATLVTNIKNCKFLPDFNGIEVDCWMVIPWDKTEFPQYFQEEKNVL